MLTGNCSFGVRRKAPTSNAERQREFRERHPGYYQRLHAKRRAEIKAALLAAQAAAEARTPLALPAPVEAILIRGMTTIPATPARDPLPIAVPRRGDGEANRLS
jgi:hypothetical protein